MNRAGLAFAGLAAMFGAALFFCASRYLDGIEAPLLGNPFNSSFAAFSKDGELLSLSLTGDEQYRLWVPLSEISPHLIRATLLYEDRHFFLHPGVNPISILRAAFQTYILRERKIGASTITMQLVRKRLGIDTRGFSGKLEQMIYALVVERRWSKEQILEAYLNLAPYGGNIQGVGAASLIAFRKLPGELKPAEAVSLAVVPQNPQTRSKPSGKAAFDSARGALRDRLAAEEHSPAEPLPRLRTLSELPHYAPHFVNRLIEMSSGRHVLRATLNLPLQQRAEEILRRYILENRPLGFNNGSVLIADRSDLSVRAYLGSAEYTDEKIKGYVNGAVAKRSPGSTLKPFIYGLAIDQGLITPDTMLKDTRRRIASYNPENFEKNFYGPLSATDALIRSRNIPALDLAIRLRPPGLYGFLQSGGVTKLREADFYGAALALGGSEVTMEELIGLDGRLVRSGSKSEVAAKNLRFFSEDLQSVELEHPPISAESSALVLGMLRTNPPPDVTGPASPGLTSEGALAWKTGTSFGARDAWAIGISGSEILGVWIGNFDGSPNPNFIGRDAAGPLLFRIAAAANEFPGRDRALSEIRGNGDQKKLNLKQIEVCALSGAPAEKDCPHKKLGWIIPGVSPIRPCTLHRVLSIDPATGRQACPGKEGNYVKEVFEFWDSDVLELFRQMGLKRKLPPPFASACFSQSEPSPIRITSPQEKVEYHLKTVDGRTARSGEGQSEEGQIGETEIEFSAISPADTRKLWWFVDGEFIGDSSPGRPMLSSIRMGLTGTGG